MQKRQNGVLRRYVAMNLFSIALGACNVLLFYVIFYPELFEGAAALAGLVRFVSRLAGSLSSKLILMGALVFAAVLVPVNNRENLKENREIDGRALNTCMAFLNAVLLLCCYPFLQLALYALRWACWFFCITFLQFGDLAWIDRLGAFLESQKFRTPAALAITALLFWRTVLRRLLVNPYRGTGGGPASYALPPTYRDGLRYVTGAGAKQYMDSFRDGRHLLLWLTATMEKGLAKIGENPYVGWTEKKPDLKSEPMLFAADAEVGGVKWNDFSALCAGAAAGWLACGDAARSVRCDEALVRAAGLLAEKDAWPYRGPCGDADDVKKVFDRLIETYRFGRGGAQRSTERAVDLAGDRDAFLRGAKRSEEKGEKELEEAIRAAREEAGAPVAERDAASSSTGGLAQEWGTAALPDCMTRFDADGTPHEYHRLNRASEYPAWYTCPDGAPDALIYVASAAAGSVFTNCGEFQI